MKLYLKKYLENRPKLYSSRHRYWRRAAVRTKIILQKHLTKDILALYQSEGYPNITKLSFKQL